MITTRFTLLAALVSATLANPLLGRIHQQRSDPPQGFTAAGFAPQDEAITFRIALTQRNFPGLEKALYAAATPGSAQYGEYLNKAQVRRVADVLCAELIILNTQVNEYASPSEEAVASVESWLASQGLSPALISSAGD